MRQTLGAILCVLVAGGALVPPASAQPRRPAKGAAADDAASLARARFDKAREAEKAGSYQEAYEEYRASFAFVPDYRTEIALAGAAFKLGKHREAAEIYRRVLANPAAKKGMKPAVAEAVQQSLTAVIGRLGALKIDAPTGMMIKAGGAQVGAAPLKDEVLVDPGELDVEAYKDGAIAAKAHVKIGAGERLPVTLVEGAGLAPSVTATATAAEAPAVTAAPPATATAAPSLTTTVESSAGPESPPPEGGARWPLVLTLGGAAIAGIALGTGLWVTADGKGAEAASALSSSGVKTNADCASKMDVCARIDGLLRSQDSLQTGAIIGWAAGGAAAIAAVTALALSRSTPQKPAAHLLLPALGPGRAGLVVHGTF